MRDNYLIENKKRRIDGSTIVCDTIKNTGNIEQATVLNHFNSNLKIFVNVEK